MSKRKKTPHWYMIVCKFQVDKDENNNEVWKHAKQRNICSEIEDMLRFVTEDNWHRLRHAFYFRNLDDALMMKYHYYDMIKYVRFLDEDLNWIKYE